MNISRLQCQGRSGSTHRPTAAIDRTGAVRAWRHLGQHLGLFDDRLHVEHTVHDVQGLQQYTRDQLRAMLAEARRHAVEAKATVVD